MRHIIYTLFCITVLMGSCIKDRSTLNLYKVSNIGIDTAGLPVKYTVFQQGTLSVKPTVTVENTYRERLKYKWTMNAYQGYERVVGTQEHLNAVITELPSAISYKLIFTATDSTNNVKAFFTWDITVISPFGQGLIVADTRDEQNSDVNLIMAFNFTTSILKDSASTNIMRNAYSTANGQKINGIVKRLSYHKYNSYKDVTFMTDKSFIRIDPNSYMKKSLDNELFALPQDKIQPDDISTAHYLNQHQYIINNGKGYGRYGDSQKFGYSFLASDKKGYQANKILGLQNPGVVQSGGVLYDELNNRFLLLPRMTSMADPLRNFDATDLNNPLTKFDPNNMGNKTCRYLFEGYDARIIAIMKERDQDKYYAYQIKLTNPFTGAMGIAVNDLSQNPEISTAKYFTSSNMEQVLFYATEYKVYATITEIGVPSTTSLRYTVKPGEKITGMNIYYGAGVYDPGAGRMYLPSTSDPTNWAKRVTLNAAQRLVILSTYNESTKEGKIITIPIETLGVGGLVTNPDYIRTYDGFGRITAFGIQI
ncbi:MAG: PKD-like family lipoprotein [Candidatus Pedobacter colombiensis]|uniref:PKD-like family lipoprotein n=1 Tax=Candidatus Pedobacter colombiensis TaxID=3121371 RepID=A0AAJ5WB65_9SPHI|nr:PKD-like family lipoprotein [Pedobacter sp.]WEK20219.1 MAG: PKD-like family lipoprotein [Pedobacter sp.]